MFLIIDIFIFFLCATVWLGPLLYNLLVMKKYRLLHPNGIFPLFMVYMVIPALKYRITGETIRTTSGIWADDPWFLTAPMLLLALAGIYYHLGVKLSGIPITMGPQDNLKNYLDYKTIQGISGRVLFFVTCAIFALTLALKLAEPTGMRESVGFYWMHIVFRSIYILPLLVFQQNMQYGLLLLILVIPFTMLIRSKAIFIYIVIIFLIFYQGKLFRLSKLLNILLILLMLMTPFAVTLYKINFAANINISELMDINMPNFLESLALIEHREYAFESFACVYQIQKREEDNLHWGFKNLTDILENIPKVLYPDKPVAIDNPFPMEYLFMDYKGYDIHYARYVLSPFLLDFGILGICLGGIVLGVLWGASYRYAIDATNRKKELWPLMLYMCLVINAKWMVEANIFSALANSIGQLFAVWVVIVIAKYFRHSLNRSNHSYTTKAGFENRKIF